jgi:NAD(P)-dependent dehydrogenase (short-subunit alcohol dehydrogenase family)
MLELEQTTPDAYDELFAVNTRAPFFITQAAAERMGEGGRIITISSGVTRQAFPNLLAYAMSKASVDVMGLTLAKALAPRGITVNTVAPGIIDTDMNAGWLRESAEGRAEAAAVSAFNRVGEPADVADVVAFVASDDARWVTGQYLDATGGSLL